MKNTTSRIFAATVAAALASTAIAQITPDPTGVNLFVAPSAANAANYSAALGPGAGVNNNLYFDSAANAPSVFVSSGAFTSGFPVVPFLPGGGTLKTIFLGESAGSLNDFGYVVAGSNLALAASYLPLATNIDNNSSGISSGYETYVNYSAGQTLDFWVNNPGTLAPGGAYFAFGPQTSAFAEGDATSHVRYTWINVTTEYFNGVGIVTGPVSTLVIAFEDLREDDGLPGNAPVPVDGDYTDFIVAFQFLPTQVPVPEPSTYGLMGAAALLGLVGYRRFKASKKVA